MDPYTSAPGSLLNRMVVPHSHLIRTAVQIQIHERKPFEPRFEPSAEVASSHHRLHRRHESPMPQLLAASFFLPQPSTILHFVLPMPHRTSTFDKGVFVWYFFLNSRRFTLNSLQKRILSPFLMNQQWFCIPETTGKPKNKQAISHSL